MSILNPCHRGLAYGDGYLQGDGELGQFVTISGNNQFTVNTDSTVQSFGILMKNYKSGDMPGIFTDGGVYETDVFDGTVNNGDLLKVSTNGILSAGVSAGDLVVAQALSVESGTLKFHLHL